MDEQLVRAPASSAASGATKYQVQLPDWTGPYDVLLQVIEEQQLDLLDLDISILLEHYLKYLESCAIVDIEEAGEFLLVAATLAQIKSKLLLPKEEQTQEEEEKDPREDLVRYLMEYQKIKQAAELLRERPLLGRDVFLKGTREQFEGMDSDGRGTLFQLVRGFQKAIHDFRQHTPIAIAREEVSVGERLRDIFQMFSNSISPSGSSNEAMITFSELLKDSSRTKMYIIVTFLAVLELIRLKKIQIIPMVDTTTNFFLKLKDGVSLESADLLESEFDETPKTPLEANETEPKASEELAV